MYVRDPAGNLVELDHRDASTIPQDEVPEYKRLADGDRRTATSARATLWHLRADARSRAASGPEIDPAGEQRRPSACISPIDGAEVREQAVEPARAEHRVGRRDVGRHARPLVRHRLVELDVELHAVGDAARPGTPDADTRGEVARRTAPSGQVEGVLVPLQRRPRPGERRRRPDRPLASARRDAPAARPTSGAGPRCTSRAERRREQLHPEARAPERDVRRAPPAAISAFSAASQGCSASSLTLIGPPIATIASIPSRLAGSGSPSSSSTRCSSGAALAGGRPRTLRAARRRCAAGRGRSPLRVLRRRSDDRAARTSRPQRAPAAAGRPASSCCVTPGRSGSTPAPSARDRRRAWPRSPRPRRG